MRMACGSDLRPWPNCSRFPQKPEPWCVAGLSLAQDGCYPAQLFGSATAHQYPSPLSDPPGLDANGQSRVHALLFRSPSRPSICIRVGFWRFFRRPSSGSSHSLDTFAGIFLRYCGDIVTYGWRSTCALSAWFLLNPDANFRVTRARSAMSRTSL